MSLWDIGSRHQLTNVFVSILNVWFPTHNATNGIQPQLRVDRFQIPLLVHHQIFEYDDIPITRPCRLIYVGEKVTTPQD